MVFVISECRKDYTCTVPGCGKCHSRYIHISQSTSSNRNSDNGVSNDVNQVTNASTSTCSNVYLPVVSVKVNDDVDAHVLLDTTSTSSFCSSGLVRRLNIKGRNTKYMLSTLNGTEEKTSTLVDFEVRSHDGSNSLRMSNVLVVDKILFQVVM